MVEKQIADNYTKLKTHQEKSNFKTLLSGPFTNKYKLWRFEIKGITYKKLRYNRLKYKIKDFKTKVMGIVQKFFEDDENSRCAAGKKGVHNS